jgi:hypothetical protein
LELALVASLLRVQTGDLEGKGALKVIFAVYYVGEGILHFLQSLSSVCILP